MDKLKEYIKQLAREVMSEESATGAIGVGANHIVTGKQIGRAHV